MSTSYQKEKVMENHAIRLVPANISYAEQVVDYYARNKAFLLEYEPNRPDEFYSFEYQQRLLADAILDREAGKSFHYYIKPLSRPDIIIGMAGLNNVIWGAFCSAFLGYKLDEKFLNKGYMTMAISMLTKHAFEDLGLHRLEANVMPRNKASLRVLEKNGYENEGLAKYYLNINGVWEDHIHMVRINHDWIER